MKKNHSKENNGSEQELLDVYDLERNYINTQERKTFSNLNKATYYETGEVKFMVKSVTGFLINSEGEYILQQRGNTQNSAGLIDKTISGHVSSGDNFDDTIVRELKEELGLESLIADNIDEFNRLIKSVDIKQCAILINLSIDNLIVPINSGDNYYERGFISGIYGGVYDGEITEFPDKEVISSSKVSSDEILDKIKLNPKIYTKSLGVLLNTYNEDILSLIK